VTVKRGRTIRSKNSWQDSRKAKRNRGNREKQKTVSNPFPYSPAGERAEVTMTV
jgi:hypothetical protein